MVEVLRASEQERSPGGTFVFGGETHGSGVAFVLVHGEPGAGPDLHTHPYSETWIVRAGEARFTAGSEELEARAGDIVVVGADTPISSGTAGPTGSTSSASTRRRA